MDIDRRKILKWSGAGAGIAAATLPAQAAPSAATTISAFGIDATRFGVRPGSPDDQTGPLQRAIDHAAGERVPLALMPGVYRAGDLRLQNGAQIVGIRGATRIVLSNGPALLSGVSANNVTLSGLILDGAKRPLSDKTGLLRLENARGLRITDCEILNSGSQGLFLIGVEGEISGNTVSDIADVAILSFNAIGLTIARNTIRKAGNNGIQIRRWDAGDDGTMVLDNRIEGITDRAGGSGQYGNGVNAHNAHNVIVRGNRIKDCAFSAVRGNTANNIHITNNSVTDVREVALYSEFAFEGAVIANNTVDGAAVGVSVCNFNEGGRLAIVSGNIIRGLLPKRPPSTAPDDDAGIGIYVEADATVTGNVVEGASRAGMMLGWGRYLRDVAVTGNVVRKSDIGIAVSVFPGSGSALIADNVITGSTRGAVVGMDHAKPVTGDLLKSGLNRYAHIAASGNHAS